MPNLVPSLTEVALPAGNKARGKMWLLLRHIVLQFTEVWPVHIVTSVTRCDFCHSNRNLESKIWRTLECNTTATCSWCYSIE